MSDALRTLRGAREGLDDPIASGGGRRRFSVASDSSIVVDPSSSARGAHQGSPSYPHAVSVAAFGPRWRPARGVTGLGSVRRRVAAGPLSWPRRGARTSQLTSLFMDRRAACASRTFSATRASEEVRGLERGCTALADGAVRAALRDLRGVDRVRASSTKTDLIHFKQFSPASTPSTPRRATRAKTCPRAQRARARSQTLWTPPVCCPRLSRSVWRPPPARR